MLYICLTSKMSVTTTLEGYSSVLLAGCGGGYDVFTALPLYYYLQAKGVKGHLASFSFCEGTKLEAFPSLDGCGIYEVNPAVGDKEERDLMCMTRLLKNHLNGCWTKWV